MKKNWLVLFFCLLIFSACVPSQPQTSSGPSVETIVASTMQAMTAAQLTTVQSTLQPTMSQPGGIPVSYNNVNFTIPLELNASSSPSTSTDVEFPYINPSGGPMAEHLVFQITNYLVQGDAKIMVFKSSDFAAYGESSQNTITALLGGQDSVQPLPKALVQGSFYAQTKTVSFKNGHGVRYLTEVLTGIAPITNQELFYYYQGITNDGAYFVSAIFHVKAPFLVADGSQNSLTPADGIPFNWGADLDFSKYLSEVTQKMNDTSPESFTVSLIFLDHLMGSLQVNNP
jgi:hypothetical protein